VVALFAIALMAACSGNAGIPQATVTVFADSSLKPAFDKIAARLLADDAIVAMFAYADTPTLVSQLNQGAPADVIASSDVAHMTTLQRANLISGQSKIFAHDKLEIAVAKGNPKGIHSLADLARPGLVVVLADPSVPAGKYAAQALNNAGVTVHPASLEQQVTDVLSKVALGEADAGIVYVSDIVPGGAVPDAQNVIADYPIAIMSSTQNRGEAETFINLVLSAEGQAILKAAGFEGV
jgi:molybdate transport system substrate-binding protein